MTEHAPHTRESELRDLKAKFMAWNVIPDLEGYLKATHGMIPFDWAMDAMRRISTPLPLTPSDGHAILGAINIPVPPVYETCAGCKQGLSICSDNNGPWYHMTHDGYPIPHANSTTAPIAPSDEMVEAAIKAYIKSKFPTFAKRAPVSVELDHFRAALTAALNLLGGGK